MRERRRAGTSGTRAVRGRAACAAALLALTAAAGAGAIACSSTDDSALLIGGERVDSTTIDRDPLALLPSGILVLGYVDAAAMFSSRMGPEVAQFITSILPLGPESNFVPSRDVARIYGGFYAMQGADFCAVMQGTFDEAAIRRAAESRATTALGAPIVKTRYAEREMFTAGNVGFVVLTNHTIITGNETGMRRALDRLRFSKLERSMPGWMTDLVTTPGAAITLAGDMSGQPAVDAASQQYPFLAGLRYVRVVGNFQPPGMNFAGALTYADAQSAVNGAASLTQLQQMSRFVSLLSSLGLGGPVPPMQVAHKAANDVAFTMTMDDSMIRLLIRLASEAARKSSYAPR